MSDQIDTRELPNGGNATECSESTAINRAAEWLSLHRETLADPVIPALRDRFALSNVEAIEALRRGRALRHARAL